MEEQSTSGLNAASNGASFQPPTRNPQSDVNTSLQTAGSNLQTGGSNSLLNTNSNILVPTPTGHVSVAPTGKSNLQSHTNAKHPPLLMWVGIVIVVVLLAGMAFGLLRPRSRKS